MFVVSGLFSVWLRRRVGKNNWLQVKYEQLATKPEETLKRICFFLGICFEPNMLYYRSRPYYGIGGNPITKDNTEERILLDERWKTELPWKHRVAFALMAGWLNKLYGYGIL
jgi:hypothetical protein